MSDEPPFSPFKVYASDAEVIRAADLRVEHNVLVQNLDDWGVGSRSIREANKLKASKRLSESQVCIRLALGLELL